MTVMDKVFDKCVDIMEVLAVMTNTTYKEINVIIFCIIEPIVFCAMGFIIWKQYKTIKTKGGTNATV